jgi:large-conductance mechanosensitive channel
MALAGVVVETTVALVNAAASTAVVRSFLDMTFSVWLVVSQTPCLRMNPH